MSLKAPGFWGCKLAAFILAAFFLLTYGLALHGMEPANLFPSLSCGEEHLILSSLSRTQRSEITAYADKLLNLNTRNCATLKHARSSAVAALDLSMPKGFIYIYDMPERFTMGVYNRTPKYHDGQYDVDMQLHRFLLTSPARTLDPRKASFFFIPMYMGYHLNTHWSFDKADKMPFANGVAHISGWLSDALSHVWTQWPYWNRTDGADHVAVFGYDNARCDAYAFLKEARKVVGELISIQANGDLTTRSWAHQFLPDRAPDDFFCYRPERDITVPVWVKPTQIVSPFEGDRNIPLLYRFSPKDQHGARYGHEIRKELHQRWVEDPFPGSDFRARTEAETVQDMTRAVFCVTPPGNTQDTARFWRAIFNGCIPVSFFRAFDRPFERSGLLDYDTFTLNLDLDDITNNLNDIIQAVLDDSKRLQSLKEGLSRVQKLFQYVEGGGDGCYNMIVKELALRTSRK